MDSFESAWLKWAWAVVQLDHLGLDIDAFAENPDPKLGISFAQEYHAKRHCIVISVETVFDPLFPDEWGLQLGDVVHSFRSSLDHLAWALYQRGSKAGTLSEYKERLVQFPICTTNWRDFGSALNRNIPGIRRADRALIRASQPYIRGKRNLNRHPLFVLNELSRFDKHRWFQPVVAAPVGAEFVIHDMIDCTYRYIAPRNGKEVLKPGTELARIFVKKTGPEPYVDMQPAFTFDPAINERLSIKEFLTKTEIMVRNILRAFSVTPQRARAVLSKLPVVRRARPGISRLTQPHRQRRA